MISANNITLSLFLVVLAGCAPFSPPSASLAVGIDGEACIGGLPAAPQGLSATHNPTMIAKAQYASGKGGVCAAQAFRTTTPTVSVYRVYDQRFPLSAYGKWWALGRPAGPREAYRQANAICPEWSKLDRLLVCQVKAGANLVLGTTQSVACEGGAVYPKTAELQVYLLSEPDQGGLNIEQCQELGDWPPQG